MAVSTTSRTAETAVPLLDLKAQYARIKPEIDAAIRDVCDSQHFIMGPHVASLEERVARYSNAACGIGVSSGTDALLVALMALDVESGDEVITTTYSFFATGGVIARLGARPVFCDIDPESYNLDAQAVRSFLDGGCRVNDGRTVNNATGNTVKAVMPVHLYGRMADIGAFRSIGDDYGLAVVEDAAQAIGSESPQGTRAGAIGDIGCFSFFPSKNLGAFGDAGLCVTGSAELAERLRILRLHGASPKYHHSYVGGNFRLDALQAAVLNVKLGYLDDWTAARQQNAAYYSAAFAQLGLPLRTPRLDKVGRHIFNQYVIQTDARDALQAWLRSKNVGTEVYYPIPLHRQACFAYLGYSAGACPVAEKAALTTLALPIYPELSRQQQDYVVDCVAQFFASSSA